MSALPEYADLPKQKDNACSQCFGFKTPCDKTGPPCSTCKSTGRVCDYSSSCQQIVPLEPNPEYLLQVRPKCVSCFKRIRKCDKKPGRCTACVKEKRNCKYDYSYDPNKPNYDCIWCLRGKANCNRRLASCNRCLFTKKVCKYPQLPVGYNGAGWTSMRKCDRCNLLDVYCDQALPECGQCWQAKRRCKYPQGYQPRQLLPTQQHDGNRAAPPQPEMSSQEGQHLNAYGQGYSTQTQPPAFALGQQPQSSFGLGPVSSRPTHMHQDAPMPLIQGSASSSVPLDDLTTLMPGTLWSQPPPPPMIPPTAAPQAGLQYDDKDDELYRDPSPPPHQLGSQQPSGSQFEGGASSSVATSAPTMANLLSSTPQTSNPTIANLLNPTSGSQG